MKRIELIARAVIVRKRHILLARKRTGDYSFLPGGHIEFGESAVNALHRELAEEIGIRFTNAGFLGVIEQAWSKKRRRYAEMNLVFKIELGRANRPVISREPGLEFFWQRLDQLKKARLLPSALQRILPEWLKSKGSKRWASHCE